MAEKTRIALPEGHVINCSLFEKEAYKGIAGAEGKPMYKIELAFNPADLASVEDALIAEAIKTWGASAEKDYDAGHIVTPLLDGDFLARKREEKKKPGDAYSGKLVIRCSTQFNKHGEDAPGGVYVCGPDAAEILPAQRSEVYQGMHGIAIVTLSTYEAQGKKGLKFFLNGFQKTRDGERLMTAADMSTLFQPVAGGHGPVAATRAGRRATR